MLDLPFHIRRYSRTANTVFLLGIFSASAIAPLHSFEYADEPKVFPIHFEQEWVSRYFNSVDGNTPIAEVVDFLVSLRTSLLAKGYQCPSLTEVCLLFRDQLLEYNIELDYEEIAEVYSEFANREAVVRLC